MEYINQRLYRFVRPRSLQLIYDLDVINHPQQFPRLKLDLTKLKLHTIARII
jgi:hypothetical protein